MAFTGQSGVLLYDASGNSLVSTGGQLQMRMYDQFGTGTLVDSDADGQSLGSRLGVINRGMMFDGTVWNREYSNNEITLLAMAARTTNASSPITNAFNARGLAIHLTFGAGAGSIPNTTEFLDLRIYDDGQGSANGPQITITDFQLYPGNQIQGSLNYTYHLVMYPGISSTSITAYPKFVNMSLTNKYFTVIVVPSGASSWTYSVTCTRLV